MGDIIWEKLAQKKRSELTKKMNPESIGLSGDGLGKSDHGEPRKCNLSFSCRD
ncbi:hypothetical protein [uncultured Eubacterium sp.]|uniref:hypothetical protein n=1 Tax=uncultured Eubacterium sp. TaxID=165185 RepID=UPI0026732EFF|nr:hypothetical protein [uncultured Eubacterium sp.]